MRQVIEEAIELLQRKEPFVLATVVHTRGMTPQKAGAMQLVRSDGSRVGTLGGGCVEGDIWFLAKEMLQEKRRRPVFRDYPLDEELAAEDGLVCGGTMYFYLEPFFDPAAFLPYAQEIAAAYAGGAPVALATVVNSGEPEKLGAKMLIRQGGETVGSLGCREWDEQAASAGVRLASAGESDLIRTGTGEEIYVEGFTSLPTLVLMGGGHVGKAVYQVAHPLGFRIIVVDDRPEFSNPERFPHAAQTVVAPFDKSLEPLGLTFNSFILVATRGHRFDDQAALAAAETPARYIGLLGSKRKNLLIFRQLLASGVSMERVLQIHAPVGLNIGARTPEEIALSIVAEMVQCLRGGDGRPLKIAEAELRSLLEERK
ncbi:MAG: hypothetical protein D6743_08745 [Calditrichaeota bacterium]|nr:MAG: hypothetical protein D6743_08745 [Calditrichota bacterium]